MLKSVSEASVSSEASISAASISAASISSEASISAASISAASISAASISAASISAASISSNSIIEFAIFGDIMREHFQKNKEKIRQRVEQALVEEKDIEYSINVYKIAVFANYKELLTKF
jgi:activator of HSP90 ATPase